MLPGYGFSPLLDVQPHLQAFHCRGESSDMWYPGSVETQALSDSREGRPLLRQHQHIAVCQQETLAFIDLQQQSVNGFQSQTLENCSSSLCSKPIRCNGNGPTDFVETGSTDTTLDNYLTQDTNNVEGAQDQMWTPITALPETVYEKPEPGVEGLSSRDLSLPLSPTYDPENRNSLEPQQLSSPPSSSDFQSRDPCRLQRRTSLGSIKEKSIRRKMRVYSPDTLSDGSISSPGVECDYLLPTSFESFVEGGLGMVGSTIPTSHSSSSLPGVDEDLSLTLPMPPKPFLDPPQEDARLEGDTNDGGRQRLGLEDRGSLEGPAVNSGTSLSLSRSRSADERRRFSASELISRLQLSQRKNSFTLKLGKSLSARVASRDRHLSGNLSSDYKPNSRHHFSGGSGDSAPHSPVGSAPPLPSADCNLPQQRRISKQSMREVSIDEDGDSPPSNSKRLSRFLPNLILYQEYSDVAINREIQRQQGAEPGTDEERGDSVSSGNLSPSSSFRSSRGSAFSLWQDIPDVRSSGQLDNFSNEERKLQEAKFELVTSEASYIRSLSIVVDHFMMSPELSECLGTQERQWLFSKLPDVKEVSERFLQDLEHRLEEDILRFDVCDIVLDHCPALRRVYLPYVTNQAYQEQTYQRLLQENPRFPGILARLEEDPVCQRLPLTSFLILPFQRITRLKMLVENILKRTTPGSRDEDTATKALNELKKIIKECNSSVQSMKRMEELIHLNKKIHFEGKIFPLISQSRWLVKHGELLEVDTQNLSISGSKLKVTTRPVYLHLFNDCLLLSRRKDTWKFMVFVHAKIEDLKVKDLSQKLQGIPGFIFYLQLCEGQQLKHQILLKSPTESSKQRWITAMFPSDLKTAIEQTNENDDLSQVQCIKSYQSQEHDELTLEKADILQAVTITSDGWVEGIRLSDGERGWFPKTYVEEITSRSARLRNLRENIRIKCVSQKLEGETL
ncbi:rho guanine nucleotide exchange factor 19-like [Carassius auratus]|uniref:Rho guanine nucleotide exchange factor 19-like n=1 Tax=Carassius auratus TaxID=7957 RepID=A0A6P6JQE7_CARAU|nr:rho guanine nucleotide exchange factor 19-like [Carassius auratus]XP_026061828.1 rho guanine nucleotide exchange factor 19-like [Carassius auratus]XP_026061830.1 rho guanine nucleotide exchange factor 19-like [Carassius auratus]